MRRACVVLLVLGTALELPRAAGAWSNPDGSAPAFIWSNGVSDNEDRGFGSPIVVGSSFVFFSGKSNTDRTSFNIEMSPGYMLTGVRAEAESIIGRLSVTPFAGQVPAPTLGSSADAPGEPMLTTPVPQIRLKYDRAHIEFGASVVTTGPSGSSFMISILFAGPEDFLRPPLVPDDPPANPLPEPSAALVLLPCLALRRWRGAARATK